MASQRRLSTAQVAAAAFQAGWFSEGLPKMTTAVAVSRAENGSGDPEREHKNSDGSIDIGLWQINSIHWSKYGGKEALKDPVNNAKAALQIFRNAGDSFSPWVAWKRGAHIVHLPAAKAAVDKYKAGSASGPESFDKPADLVPDAVKNPLENLGQFIGALLNPRTWIRIVQVIGGGGLIILGLLMLARDTTPTLRRITR